MSKLTVAKVKDLMKQVSNDEITYSRMVELMNEKKSETNFPRRNRLDLNTKVELSISNAIDEVEKIGADVRLTDAVIKLSEAKDLVSDFVDEQMESVS